MMDASLSAALAEPTTQQAFATLVGISQPVVSDLVARGILLNGQPVGIWLLAYIARLREQAAGRDQDGRLSRERAELAKSMRKGQDIRNERELGEFAPLALQRDVLSLVQVEIAARLDALPAQVAEALPDLPPAALTAVVNVAEAAKRQWLRATASLAEPEPLNSFDETDDESLRPGDGLDSATGPEGLS